MILYIGNILSTHGYNQTTIEVLGKKLSQYVEILCTSDKKIKTLRLLDMIYTIIKYRQKVKLVLIDTYSNQAFFYCFIISLICRLLKAPYIPILHSGDIASINHSLLSKVLESSCKIVVPSIYIKDQIPWYQNKIVYIPNFIDLENYVFKLRSTISPKILWVRSFHSRYAPELAVNIICQLKAIYPGIKMSMIGPDKGKRQNIQKLIEDYNLGNNISLHGKLSKTDWHKYSQSFDLFLNTSQIDNQPVSILEAMALGLPVVSSNVGDIPNMIEHRKEGLLVEAPDVSAYVEAIDALFANLKYAENVSLNARRKAEQYDWDNIKSLWKDLLDEYL